MYIDCTWSKVKNLQKIKTIEIFFTITTTDLFMIEYNFHSIDFELWKEIINIHIENIKDYKIHRNEEKIDLKNFENLYDYYSIKLTSKDFNLYRNINLIFFNDPKEIDEKLQINTW